MAASESHALVRTRKRPTLSCETCRKRKARCDRRHPCSNCVRWNVDASCVYNNKNNNNNASSPSATRGSAGNKSINTLPAGAKILANSSATSSQASLPTHHRKIAPHVVRSHEQDRQEARGVPPCPAVDGGVLLPSSARPTSVEDDRPKGGVNHVWRSTSLASIFVGAPPEGPSADEDKEWTSHTSRKPSRGAVIAEADDNGGGGSGEPLFPRLDGITGPIRGAFYKNRWIGQSHWMYSWTLCPEAMVIVGQEMKKEQESWRAFQECKALARSIKAQRPGGPTRTSCAEFGRHLPDRDLGRKLLDGYLETFETVYRIFMVPKFRRECEEILWSRGTGDDTNKPASRDHLIIIIIQAQLCMAIGATVSHEGSWSSWMRPQMTTQWVSEGCAWAAHSPQKTRLTVPGLQTLCLLHIARQACAVEADLSWIPAGSLLRTAVCMGLHIDPSMLPAMPVAEVELRRRLWWTVLEISLEASVCAGAPALMSSDEFGCEMPSNCDDEQLLASGSGAAGDNLPRDRPPRVTKPDGHFTETSAQIALARSFETRLSIVGKINQPNLAIKTTYAELVQLTTTLDAACRQLRSDFSFDNNNNKNTRRPSSFQVKYCTLMLERYYLAIHIAYLALAAQRGPSARHYSLSRTTCVDTALRILNAGLAPSSSLVFGSSPAVAPMLPPVVPVKSGAINTDINLALPGTGVAVDDLDVNITRGSYAWLLLRGSGQFRSIPLQCIIVLAFELIDRFANKDVNGTADPAARSSPPASSLASTLRAPLSSDHMGCDNNNNNNNINTINVTNNTGLFDTLRDVELHLLLRVGAEWTADRISEAGDVNAKDHAFVALLLAIAEEQIKGTSGDNKGEGSTESSTGGGISSDALVRRRYCAAFLDCKDRMIKRIEEGRKVTSSEPAAGGREAGENNDDRDDQGAGAINTTQGLGGTDNFDCASVPVVGNGLDSVFGPPVNVPSQQSWGSNVDADYMTGTFDGFWMGDVSDDLDWDELMDFQTGDI